MQSLIMFEIKKMSSSPFSKEIMQKLYPKGYETPKFMLFNEKEGNTKEHITCFIDTLKVHPHNKELRLRKFLKLLIGRAYS